MDLRYLGRRAIFVGYAIGVLAVFGSVFWLVTYRGSSSAQGATLQGVAPADLSQYKIELTAADGGAKVTKDTANAVATANSPAGRIRETVLLNMTNGAQYKEPRLAWAINFDPTSVTLPAVGGCVVGGGVCPRFNNLSFAVTFIDAQTGEFLFFGSGGQDGASPKS